MKETGFAEVRLNKVREEREGSDRFSACEQWDDGLAAMKARSQLTMRILFCFVLFRIVSNMRKACGSPDFGFHKTPKRANGRGERLEWK